MHQFGPYFFKEVAEPFCKQKWPSTPPEVCLPSFPLVFQQIKGDKKARDEAECTTKLFPPGFHPTERLWQNKSSAGDPPLYLPDSTALHAIVWTEKMACCHLSGYFHSSNSSTPTLVSKWPHPTLSHTATKGNNLPHLPCTSPL